MKGIYLIPDIEHLDESLELLKECNGNFEYNDFYHASVLEDRKCQGKLIERYAKVRSDFSEDTIHGAFLDVTVHSTDPLIREASELRVRQSMEVAKEMGARGVVFHTNRIFGFRDPSYLKHWKEANELFFRKIAEEFPKQCIFLENMFDESPDLLAALAESMKDVSNFGVCLDYAHAMVFNGQPNEWVQSLRAYTKHIHINDNDLKEDLHLPIGEGAIDWDQFGVLWREAFSNTSVLVEVKGIEKQRKSLEYIRQKRLLI